MAFVVANRGAWAYCFVPFLARLAAAFSEVALPALSVSSARVLLPDLT